MLVSYYNYYSCKIFQCDILYRREEVGHAEFSLATGSKKIVYDRDELLSFRYSPLSMTPPSNLEEILKATKPAKRRSQKKSKHIAWAFYFELNIQNVSTETKHLHPFIFFYHYCHIAIPDNTYRGI